MKMKTKKKARRARTRPLFTIGYEQAKLAAVLNELKRAKIELLVDTRAVAASRRPGFSKGQLALSLEATPTPYGAFTTSTSGNMNRSKNSVS
jgi:uncharacterized protein (DUF488 family)